MTLSMPNNRFSAAGSHFLISVFIFAGIIALFYFVWFPGAYLRVGGTEGLAMLAGVDLVLGPVLTLIVYNKAKKSLKWDLSFIATLQIACLVAGLWVVEKQRPLAQIVVDDKVHVFTKEDLVIRNISLEKIHSMPGHYPKPIFVDLPVDTMARQITKATSFIQGPLAARENLYLPLEDADEAFFANFKQDADSQCYEVTLAAEHYQGKACLSLSGGVVKLN